jgi:DNA (cytosine-5)-methyltransferase 1
MLEEHFQSPNSSHLPVIAIYSIYQLLIDEVVFYSALKLRELGRHEAADLRTGSIGDIELEDSDGDVIEGSEIKHGIEIDLPIILRAKEKILKSKTKRYYILTTHHNCGIISDDVLNVSREIYNLHGAQVIINGVLPTIKYYLRMCRNPSTFINNYSNNLASQSSVTTVQLQYWDGLLEKCT